MHILRRIALTILSPLFIFLLFTTAFDIGLIRTAGNPEAAKGLIAKSGLYDTVVPSLLAQQKTISTPIGTLSASDPLVKQAASQAVSPKYIQQSAESAIDNIYMWLEGKVEIPTFNFNLASQNPDFADSVAASVQQRLESMPPCTNAQSLAIARSGSFDALNATCLPRGTTAASIAQQAKTYLLTNSSFLDKAHISTADLKDKNGRTLFDQPGVKNIPVQYQRAKKSPWILSILTLLVGVAIVFLSASKLAGLRHIGINLLIVGVIMIAFSWLLNWGVNKKLVPKINIENAVLQQNVRNLSKDLVQQVDRNYWFFGGLYLALGTISVSSSIYLNKINQPPATTRTASPSKKR